MAIGVGMLGCGMITQLRHAPEYARDPRATIALVWDADPARAQGLADRYGAPVDAVSVCTPNHLHGPQTVAALGAGKHVLCEMPMASSLQEARTKVDGLAALGVVEAALASSRSGGWQEVGHAR